MLCINGLYFPEWLQIFGLATRSSSNFFDLGAGALLLCVFSTLVCDRGARQGIADPLNDTSGSHLFLMQKLFSKEETCFLSMRRSSACRSCEASSLDELVANIAVSSAYVATVQVFVTGISAVYRVYKTGPKTLPCGTLAFIKCKGEYSFFLFHIKLSIG